MPMPNAWAEALISRLVVRYGEAFMRQWHGVDRAVVVADWAIVLDGVRPEAITYALENLTPDRPPNAMQFRDLCRRSTAAERQPPALPAPVDPPTVEVKSRLRQVAERMKDGIERGERLKASMLPRLWAIRQLTERMAEHPPTEAQRRTLAALQADDMPSHDLGSFTPIPDHVLPPGMRTGVGMEHQ